MSLLYDIFRCFSNCFKHLRIFCIAHIPYLICVFFETFKKTNSILCLKLFISLFIFHMLDQMLDQIIIVLTQYFFYKKISLNFPFVLLVTIIIYKVITNTFFLENNDIFLLHHFKILLKFLNLIMHWIFGLITSLLKCSTHSEEV